MYWRLGFGVNKEIDQILDNHNVELEEILQEDSVVHESKSHNYRLIEYLTLPHNLRKLLSYSIGKATVDDDRNKLRFPYVATEILSSDIPAIHNTLLEPSNRNEYIQPFWDFIINKSTQELNDLNPFVGYWGKILAKLLDTKSDQVVEFLKAQPSPIDSFLKHIETPVIGDLLFRLIVSDHHNSSLIEFFTQSDFIPKLSNILSSEYSKDAHLAVSDLMKTVITFSAPSPPAANGDNQIFISNNLARQLASDDLVNKLINFILDDVPVGNKVDSGDISTNHLPDSINDSSNEPNNEKFASVTSSLISILSIYIELIRKNNADFSEPHLFHTLRNKLITIQQSQHQESINSLNEDDTSSVSNMSNLNDEQLSKKEEEKEQSDKDTLEEAMNQMSQSIGIVHLGSILKAFTNRLSDFQSLLNHPRSYKGMIMSSTGPIKPLTFERFRICELYAELLHCSNMAIFNRPAFNGPHYDGYGRLIGGLEALTQLSRALSDSEETDENEEMEEIPVDAPHSDSTHSDSTHPHTPHTAERSENTQQLPQSTSSLSIPHAHTDDNQSTQLTTGESLKKALINNGILKTLTDLFFEYASNPFLHNVVYDVILQVLNAPLERGLNMEVAVSLFNDARLIEKLLIGHGKVKESVERKTPTPGYSGHVMLIADECQKVFEKHDTLYERIKTSFPQDEWDAFVQGPLRTVQNLEKEPLGGIRPDTNPFGQYGKVEGDQDDSDSDDDIGFMSAGFGSSYRSLSGQSHANINFDEDDDDDDSFFSSFSFKGAHPQSQSQSQSLDEDDMNEVAGGGAQLSKFMNTDDDEFGDFTQGGMDDVDPFGMPHCSSSGNPFGDNFAPAATQNLTPADWSRDFKESVDSEGEGAADIVSTITIPDFDDDEHTEHSEHMEEMDHPEHSQHTQNINDAIKGLKIGKVVDEREASSQADLDTGAPLGPGSNAAAEVTDECVKREVDGVVVEAPKDDMVLIAEDSAKTE
ncbi:hypothetical protein E3P78_01674 [Wallemia ichthyophaga]|nr:hypothetical protein E3P78_01674 [Wallemia ichthyophaga]